MKVSVSVLVLCLVGVAMAQRSPYAPRPVGYPQVLDRFNENAGSTDANGIPNRLGGTEDQGPLQPQAGTVGDPYLLPHLPQWSPEHQPFWYLNQQHIKNHLNQGQRLPAATGTQTGQNTGTQTGQNTGTQTGQRQPAATGTQTGQRRPAATGTQTGQRRPAATGTLTGQTTGTRVQSGQMSGTGLNTRLGDDQGATSTVLGSQRVQSSFVKRPVHRPEELHRPENSQ